MHAVRAPGPPRCGCGRGCGLGTDIPRPTPVPPGSAVLVCTLQMAMPAPAPRPGEEKVKGRDSRIPRRVSLGARGSPGCRGSERNNAGHAPHVTAPASAFPSASDAQPGRRRATLSFPGPPRHRPRHLPGRLAFTHKAAIACVPLGSPSCTLCHCPTTTLGGRSEYTAAL